MNRQATRAQSPKQHETPRSPSYPVTWSPTHPFLFFSPFQEIFDKAMVTSAEDACKRAESIGFPIMVKASEGGGGKGIRKATNMEDGRADRRPDWGVRFGFGRFSGAEMSLTAVSFFLNSPERGASLFGTCGWVFVFHV